MINLGILTAHHYPRLGGMEYAVHFMANELHKNDSVQVNVACNSLKGISKTFHYNYNCYRAKSFSYLTPWLFKYNQDKMIKEQHINLLHDPMLHGGGYYCYQQKLKQDIPYIAHLQGADVQVVKAIAYGALLDSNLKQRIKKVVKHADHLIAASKINKQNMIDLGADANKISIVHNGIQIEEINKIPFQNQRALWGIEKDDFLIITVGRNKPVKRMSLLFEALEKLKEYKKIKCICVGPVQGLQQLAKNKGIQDHVIFTGQIPKNQNINIQTPYPELINLYRSSNIYISTSYVESFGNAAADSLACGIPIIIGKKHGIRDAIVEGETGWVIDEETPASLAEMILTFYKQRDTFNNNQVMISQSVEHLTWENIAKQMMNIFNKIV
ncbi:glycosyltransferase [Flavivirga aquimarina]|uniref:Glycosyltransferase n=1 Tax=Flavivirga aquimarina TaxID=2027862 RepID=A0ABT8W712_9FLAO|nr:glycosyltransferase [Flavivirga aquimarina]MDO5968901.1 glycosyltransferase [Flavivirga aquimarina]